MTGKASRYFETIKLTVDPDFEYLAELTDLKVLFLGERHESR